MAKLGIDISKQQSKTLDRYLNDKFDEIISVCDSTAEAYPDFHGAKKLVHWSFPDPSKATENEKEKLAVYRHVRDAIRRRIKIELLS